MTAEKFDFLIAGTGIIGLTLGYELRKRYPKSSIGFLEKESRVGLHASGRNSGILHSGIYYKKGSLKAKVCREGGKLMKEFAKKHDIPCRESGKLIVATHPNQLPALENLFRNAQEQNIPANKCTPDQLREFEPSLQTCVAGIHCPTVGVIDSLPVLEKLVALLTQDKATFHFKNEIIAIDQKNQTVQTQAGKKVGYGFFFNCAGTSADIIAHQFGEAQQYALVPFKGIYYQVRPEKGSHIKNNIYPVPDPSFPFLGVHFTRSINGKVYVGPTAIPALGRENYGLISGLRFIESLQIAKHLTRLYFADNKRFRRLVHSEIKKYFKPFLMKEVQAIMPHLSSSDIQYTGKVGIRPQLINRQTNELVMDYILARTKKSIHVLNAISPAFTGSFKFAETILEECQNDLG